MGKIAVIDSGIGGLTVTKELMNVLPQEDIVYFGDQKNCPYGDKTKEAIQQYVIDIVDFLRPHDLKALVIACNTATSVVLPQLSERYPFPIIGVIEPGATHALQVSQNQQIAVIGTKKTIETGAYEKALRQINPNVTVYSTACPKIVPLLEGESTTPETMHLTLEEYLFPLKSKGIDTLVLGCTHYPLVAKQIQQILGKNVTLVNPAFQTVVELTHVLEENHLLNTTTQGDYLFYTSGDPQRFDEKASAILGFSVSSKKEETIFKLSKLS